MITILCDVVKYIEAPSELISSTVVENGSRGSVSLPCPFLIIVIGLLFSPTSDHGLNPLKSVTVYPNLIDCAYLPSIILSPSNGVNDLNAGDSVKV